MKKVLAFDVDQTLNIAKTPIPPEIAELLTKCLDHYEICPISGQKYDQFIFQIVVYIIALTFSANWLISSTILSNSFFSSLFMFVELITFSKSM